MTGWDNSEWLALTWQQKGRNSGPVVLSGGWDATCSQPPPLSAGSVAVQLPGCHASALQAPHAADHGWPAVVAAAPAAVMCANPSMRCPAPPHPPYLQVHQREPLFVGSKWEVEYLESVLQGKPMPQ